MNRSSILAACLAFLTAGGASAGDCAALGEVYRIGSDIESRIQVQVLDVMLEPGRAYAFLEVKAELRVSSEEEGKSGVGETHKTLAGEEGGKEGEGKESMQKQTAKQTKKSGVHKKTFGLELGSMKLKVLHDAGVPADRIKAVKQALLALFPGKLEAKDIVFVPAPFQEEGSSEDPAGE